MSGLIGCRWLADHHTTIAVTFGVCDRLVLAYCSGFSGAGSKSVGVSHPAVGRFPCRIDS